MRELLLCLLNVGCLSIGQIMFKVGMKDKNISSILDILQVIFSPVIFCAIIIYGMTTILWLYILNRVDISFAYPIQSLAMPIVCACGVIMFGESLTITKLIGIIVITIGIIIISR